MLPRIYVIVGPTASGKSAYAVELGKKIGGEVISADSRQVYRGLDIGSGKITKKEMRGVPHYMLDVVDPRRTFTAHDYARMARPILEDIQARKKVPIICGGTGFYIDTLLGRITLPDVPPNSNLRARLAKKSVPELFALLQEKDPRRAATIDPENPVRLIRALEIADALGAVPQTELSVSGHESEGGVRWIGILRSEAELRERIHARLLTRMKSGMVAEAKRLHERGLSYKRMEELGLEYRYLSRYLRGTMTKEAMLAELERAIFLYARRQMTYWRRNTAVVWKKLTDL
jgi:tRNA dimethylallyltransferase